jgi:lipid-binding SYLF domain-containing protein|tara:strand:+ start:11138 stop:11713 length:576 start_codon:yes stop_codon:yes gene_type:complete
MTMRKHRLLGIVVAAGLALGSASIQAGWDPFKKGQGDTATDAEEVDTAIAQFLAEDRSLKAFFDEAYGYAVFPNVYKGGIGVGGAYGKGRVYRRGEYVGDSKLYQLTAGFQLGGQAYSEVVFLGDADAFERFTSTKMEFSAQVSAVAVTAGASADAAYEDGVAVFTLAKGGLMWEASVGGQTFEFEKKTGD